MRRAAILLCLVLLPLPGAAQHWMTRERCTVTDIRIDPDVLAPEALQRLRATAATVPNGVGTYWQITAPGGAVSHLWGTWHSNDPLMLDLPARVIAQVRAARVAAFEIDPVLPTRRAVENAASPRDFWIRRGGTLAQMDLPPEIERWINARLIGLGWGDGSADFMMPGALVELLLGDPCNDYAMGTYPNQDSYLQTIAAIGGAQILALEDLTALRQKLNQRRHRALARDILMLYGSALSPDGTAAERATAFAIYQSGEHALARAWERQALTAFWDPDEADRIQQNADAYLLDERNAVFVDTVLPELRRGDVFIAVGAWHLQGRLGMVARLREAGFEVKRIPLDQERPGP